MQFERPIELSGIIFLDQTMLLPYQNALRSSLYIRLSSLNHKGSLGCAHGMSTKATHPENKLGGVKLLKLTTRQVRCAQRRK
jgi:hypothetical protein